jgi:hypothetical protein
VLGEPDQLTRQQFEGPSGAASGWLGTGGCHQQGFLLARELSARARAWLFAQRRFQVAEHEAPLGPVHGRATHADAARDLRVAAASAASKICARLSLRTARSRANSLSCCIGCWPMPQISSRQCERPCSAPLHEKGRTE